MTKPIICVNFKIHSNSFGEKAEELANELSSSIVINGDALVEEILKERDIKRIIQSKDRKNAGPVIVKGKKYIIYRVQYRRYWLSLIHI